MVTVAAVVLATGGCMVGPDYTAPETEVPAEFKGSGPWQTARPDAAAQQRGSWWRVFGDAELDRLLAAVERDNPNVQAAAMRLEQAQARTRALRGVLMPELIGRAGLVTERHSDTVRDTGFASGRRTVIRVPLEVAYEVDLWGRARRGIESALADEEAASADTRAVLLGLQAELAANYLRLRSLEAERQVLQRALEVRQENLDLVESRFRGGDVAELDVSQARTELAEIRAELVALDRQRVAFENAVAVLTGQLASDLRLSAPALSGRPPSVPRVVPSQLLERRPDVAAAERRMARENAAIGVATAALYPNVQLSATAGLASADLGDLFNADSLTWGVGPELVAPLLDGGRRRAAIDEVSARYREVAADYRATVLRAFGETEDALAALANLAEEAAAVEETLVAARRTEELALRRYEGGLVAYFEVVDAQRTVLRNEQAAARLLGARYEAMVDLIRALGGGWQR